VFKGESVGECIYRSTDDIKMDRQRDIETDEYVKRLTHTLIWCPRG
jgi:hypothetical protein